MIRTGSSEQVMFVGAGK